ncbi:MAG TPA: dihydrodipicolinate synthase family protein [Gammaproteobacteria bacterium]|nr:dihydrodipicolinate synthase family protein [Gammaproteobacteria bacterium]
MSSQRFSGVLVPVITPFKNDLSPDVEAFVTHCKWMLGQGVDGLAIFGTTSEANSLTVNERTQLLDALVESGVPAARLMPGTGACSIMDASVLTAHAVNHGCGGVLMLPPFYYKAVDTEGLYASFVEVIQRVGDDRLKIYLYHIPPVAQISIGLDLIERLIDAYPDTVVGLKDSSGDWDNTKAILDRFPGFSTFAGSEGFLLDTLRHGGAGCITASGNANPAGIRKVYSAWKEGSASVEALQARISQIRVTLQTYPMIPALKAMTARFTKRPSWALTRPPLVPLSDKQATALLSDLDTISFDIETNGDCVNA